MELSEEGLCGSPRVVHVGVSGSIYIVGCYVCDGLCCPLASRCPMSEAKGDGGINVEGFAPRYAQ